MLRVPDKLINTAQTWKIRGGFGFPKMKNSCAVCTQAHRRPNYAPRLVFFSTSESLLF
jgi:hypothetical protein